MGVLRHEETANITQHHQDVLVHGVHVEQVVLHLTHDAPEHPQVAAQHRGLVHLPQGMGLTLRGLQNLHEGGAVDGVAAKSAVHQVAGVVQRPQRAGRQPFGRALGLEGEEGLQDGVGVALVEVVTHHFEQTAAFQKMLVDGAHGRVLLPGDALFNVLDQNLAELGYRLGCPVVATHQHFGGTLALAGGVAKTLSHGGL